MRGDPERIVVWTQVITGLEVDALTAVHVLDATTWQQRRQRLHVERMALAIGDEQHVARLRPSEHVIERTADFGAAARPAERPH